MRSNKLIIGQSVFFCIIGESHGLCIQLGDAVVGGHPQMSRFIFHNTYNGIIG